MVAISTIRKLVIVGATPLLFGQVASAQVWDCPTRAHYQALKIPTPLPSSEDEMVSVASTALNNSGMVVGSIFRANFVTNQFSSGQYSYSASNGFVEMPQGKDFFEANLTELSDSGVAFGNYNNLQSGYPLLTWSRAQGYRSFGDTFLKFKNLTNMELLSLSRNGKVLAMVDVDPYIISSTAISVVPTENAILQFSSYFSINDSSKLAGTAYEVSTDSMVPIITSGNTIQKLSISSSYSFGWTIGLNNRNYVLGSMTNIQNGYARAFLASTGASTRNIVPPAGYVALEAAALNNNNEVIGSLYGSEGEFAPFIWNRCVGARSVGDLLPAGFPDTLYELRTINDQGQILATGFEGEYILTPQ